MLVTTTPGVEGKMMTKYFGIVSRTGNMLMVSANGTTLVIENTI